MKPKRLFECLGGPLDGTTPPWADGRDRFYVPVVPTTLREFKEHATVNRGVEKETYYLVHLLDGRTVYLWEDSYEASRGNQRGREQ